MELQDAFKLAKESGDRTKLHGFAKALNHKTPLWVIEECFATGQPELCTAIVNTRFTREYISQPAFQDLMLQVPSIIPYDAEPLGKVAAILDEEHLRLFLDLLAPDMKTRVMEGAISRATNEYTLYAVLDAAKRDATYYLDFLVTTAILGRFPNVLNYVYERTLGSDDYDENIPAFRNLGRSLATNYATPANVVDKLVRAPETRYFAVEHPNTSASSLVYVLKNKTGPHLIACLKRLNKHQNSGDLFEEVLTSWGYTLTPGVIPTELMYQMIHSILAKEDAK